MKILSTLLLILLTGVMMGQTVIEPKVNANTVNGIPYPTTIGNTGEVITPIGGELVWSVNPSFVGVLDIDASNISQVQLFRVSDTIAESFGHVHNEYKLVNETILNINVSNPPTDAELDAAFGTPPTVGKGWSRHINDNGAGLNFYRIVSDSTSWWIFTGTKAL